MGGAVIAEHLRCARHIYELLGDHGFAGLLGAVSVMRGPAPEQNSRSRSS